MRPHGPRDLAGDEPPRVDATAAALPRKATRSRPARELVAPGVQKEERQNVNFSMYASVKAKQCLQLFKEMGSNTILERRQMKLKDTNSKTNNHHRLKLTVK